MSFVSQWISFSLLPSFFYFLPHYIWVAWLFLPGLFPFVMFSHITGFIYFYHHDYLFILFYFILFSLFFFYFFLLKKIFFSSFSIFSFLFLCCRKTGGIGHSTGYAEIFWGLGRSGEYYIRCKFFFFPLFLLLPCGHAYAKSLVEAFYN